MKEFMVEKSGVEKSRVEKSGVGMSCNLLSSAKQTTGTKTLLFQYVCTIPF